MSEQTVDAVSVTMEDAVAVVTLCNPPVGALGMDLVRGLRSAVDELAAADDVAAVVIRSALPRYFGAGADLRLLEQATPEEFADYLTDVRGAVDAVESLRCVTIAAIDGAALGGGLELALACDLRWASRDARLGLPEIKLGLLPGAGGTQRLTRLVGAARSAELILSGRMVAAEEAAGWGLVMLAEKTAERAAMDWATRYAKGSTTAGEAILRCVAAATTDPASGMEIERQGILDLFTHGDARRRISAFLDRTDSSR
jgi:enoyl-CoA hydratase/carnithine racemase